MKTIEEKANELIDKFLNLPIHFPYIDSDGDQCISTGYMTYYSAVDCAIIEVDEILKSIPTVVLAQCYGAAQFENPDILYWRSVKKELENLKN